MNKMEKETKLPLLLIFNQWTITQKIGIQERSEPIVVFTIILCGLKS